MSASFSMDFISAPPRNLYPHIPDSMNTSKSEDRFSLCASWTINAYSRRTTTPFASLLSDRQLVRPSTAPYQHHAVSHKLLAPLCPRCKSTIVLQLVATPPPCFPRRHPTATNY